MTQEIKEDKDYWDDEVQRIEHDDDDDEVALIVEDLDEEEF